MIIILTIPENIKKHQKLSQYSQDIAYLSQWSTLFISEKIWETSTVFVNFHLNVC